MKKNGEWADDGQPEKVGLAEVVPQRSDAVSSAASLGEMVAHDAHRIMSKLIRYRDELKRDEARILEALEQVRAEQREAGEVMQALQPAMEAVGRMSGNGSASDGVREAASAVKRMINGLTSG